MTTPDRDAVLAGEEKIPLIVGGHSHDDARAVFHEGVIRNEKWNPISVHPG